MVSKIVELLVNLVGVLNCSYDRFEKVLRPSRVSLVFSETIFLLLLLNILDVYKDRYFDTRSDLMYFLVLADDTLWIILLVIYNLDRLFRGHRYINVLNRLFRLENTSALLSGGLTTIWQRRFSRVLYGTIFFIFLYIPIKTFRLAKLTLVKRILRVLYAFTFLASFLLNGVFEMAVFQKIYFDFKHVLKHLVTKQFVALFDLQLTFDMQTKLLDITRDVGKLFVWTKLLSIVFLFAALPVYVFFIYFGWTDKSCFVDLPGYVFWMLLLVFLMFTSCVWDLPYSEVSDF